MSVYFFFFFLIFFFNDTATTEIYTLSLHDALPICNLVTLNAGVFVWTTGVVVYAWTSSGVPFVWGLRGLQLLQTANSAFGKYLGFFASAKSKKTSIIGFLSEYVNRERW